MVTYQKAGVSDTVGSTWWEFRNSYPVLLAAIAGTAVGMAGTIVYSLPFLVQPLQDAFGWSRDAIAGVVTAHTIGMLVGGPIAGRICDRVGVAKTAFVATLGFAAILVAMSVYIHSLPTLYLGYLLASLLGTGTTYVIYLKTIAGRFDKGRGLALGMTMSGGGFMAVLIPHVLPGIIASHGWRAGYVAIAAVSLLALPLCLGPLRSPPRSAASVPRSDSGISFREAVRTRQFWCMWAGVLLLAMTTVGSHLFLVQIVEEAGVAKASVAGLMSLYGAAIVIGRVLVGYLLDRFHGPYVAAANFILPAIGMVALAHFGAPAAYAYLFFLGVVAGAEGDVVAYLSGRYFGLRAYSETFGWLFTGLAIGFAAGPLIAGTVRDAVGSFTPMLYIGAANCTIAALLFLGLGPYRVFAERHEKEAVPSVSELGENSILIRA